MMANHRPQALTTFDHTHIVHVFSTMYMYMYMYMYIIAHSKQLLGQPITNENTSLVFEFGNELRLNVGMYRRIKAR